MEEARKKETRKKGAKLTGSHPKTNRRFVGGTAATFLDLLSDKLRGKRSTLDDLPAKTPEGTEHEETREKKDSKRGRRKHRDRDM